MGWSGWTIICRRSRNTGSRVWRSQEQEGQTTRLAIFLNGVVVRPIVVPHDVLPDQDVLTSVQSNWAFWLPAECIVRSRSERAYPSVTREGKSCRLTNMEGNSWIDMAMTGSSALLGYAHPAVQAAIAVELSSSRD